MRLPPGFHEHHALQPTLDCIWTAMPIPGTAPGSARIVPDNCADIIGTFHSDGALDELFVVGTMTRPIEVTRPVDRYSIGLRFSPGIVGALFEMSAAELTDIRVDLRDISPRLCRKLVHVFGKTWSDLAALQVELAHLIQPARPLPAVVQRSMTLLRASNGTTSVDELSKLCGVSRQHMARLFNRYVGVSPKLFARVHRAHRAREIHTREQLSWSRVAADLGYADHSHLILDHQALFGTSPGLFAS